MIRTVRIEVNAAYPDMPLERTAVYTGSAASFTIINVPRKHGKRDISGVSVSVTNAAGETKSFAAVRDGCAWNATVPASAIGAAGNIERGLVIAASGVDENDGVVPCWILGCGDIAVMPLDGQIVPGETATNLRGFDETPSAPSKWNVRRSASGFEVYDGMSWVALGGVGDMKHSEFEGLEWRDNMTQKESNTLLGEIVSKLKGTAILLLCAFCLPVLAVPLSPDMDFGDISPTAKVSAVVHAAVDGAARPLPKYLHLYDANDSYPSEAAEYYRQRGSGVPAASCSAVRDGGFLYRNFDYPFDDRAEFVVRMSAGPNRFASIGVAQVGTNLTEQMVTSGKPEYSNIYKWLPGATVDGINEHGVVAEINVVDGDPQWRSGVPAALKIHPLAAVRWSLDNGTSAGMVASNLAARIAFPEGWTQNFHYMIADATSTYIVENGTAYQGGSGVSPLVMTNFRLYPTRDTTGAGQERYDLLLSSACITNAWYTRAYRRETNPPWVSDLREVLAYTNDIFNAWATHPKEYFRGKDNNGIPWWQTVHTSVYDITNRTLRVAVQETDDWYTFQVPVSGGLKVETDPVWSAEKSGYQPKISDLEAIRAGAAAGATAYQKPSGGIPKSDLAAGVKESLGKADTALQSFTEQDPTVGLTNGTIHIKGASITPITEHQSLADYFTKAESSTNAEAVANRAIATNAATTNLTARMAEKRDMADLSFWHIAPGEPVTNIVFVVESDFSAIEGTYVYRTNRGVWTNGESAKIVRLPSGEFWLTDEMEEVPSDHFSDVPFTGNLIHPTLGAVKFTVRRKTSATIALTEQLPDMNGYYTKSQSDTNATAKANAAIAAAGCVRTNSWGEIDGGEVKTGDWRMSAERGFEYQNQINFAVGIDPNDGYLRFGEIRPNGGSVELFAHLDDIPDVSGFVPYTGAMNNVDLGDKWLSAYYIISSGVYGYYQDLYFGTGYTSPVIGVIWDNDNQEDYMYIPGGSALRFDDGVGGTETIDQRISRLAPHYTPSATDPTFSTAVLAVTTNTIRREVSSALNTYIDGDTGVEYVGKFYGGSLYYVPTGNVYPPNN